MEELKDLIEKGIVYEDDFIALYLKVVKDEGFMAYFENKRHEAEGLLNVLISESQEHKQTLENIIKNVL